MLKHTRHLLMGAVTLLFAAGCGGAAAPASSPAPSSAAPAASAAAKPSAATSPSAKPAASAAAKPSAGVAAGGSIKIGYIIPLTGVQADIAKYNQDGFNMYLDSVGGMLAGRKVEVSYADDQLKPDVGLTKAKELVENSKVHLLMGMSSTSVAYPVAQYAKTSQTPLIISTNAGSQGMTMNPQFASPYLVRITQNGAGTNDVLADWLIKQGKKKAIMLSQDFAAGYENADLFGSAYVFRGGSIVQEVHPAVGTSDFGPFIAQLPKDADVIYEFEPGVDGLRLLEQYYTIGPKNLMVADLYAGSITGANLAQLKEKAVGITGIAPFAESYDDPAVQAFVKAWKAKFPNQPPDANAAAGYAGAQVLEAALKKIDGKIEDKQAFLDALYQTNLDTARGPIKLDQFHDVVQDMKIFTVEKQGSGIAQKMIETYKGVGQFWDRSEDQLRKFEFGKMKGKWVGMTKDQLGDVITLPKS